jgi:hypothetical protein
VETRLQRVKGLKQTFVLLISSSEEGRQGLKCPSSKDDSNSLGLWYYTVVSILHTGRPARVKEILWNCLLVDRDRFHVHWKLNWGRDE